MKLRRRLLVLASSLGVFVALTAPASATVNHNFLFNFNGSATPAGSFSAGGLAVDNSSSSSAGDVYLFDFQHKVVDKFSATGSYLCEITGVGSASTSATECDKTDPGAPAGAFSIQPNQEAVSSSSGDLYVPQQSVVDVFGPTGGYLSQIQVPGGDARGVAVDAATGKVYIGDNANQVVDVFDPTTGSLSTFVSGSSFTQGPSFSVAVDNDPSSPSYQDVYVGAGNALNVYDQSGSLVRSIVPPNTPYGGFKAPGLAVDPANGDVYATLGSPPLVDQFDASGNFLGAIDDSGTPTPGTWDPVGVALSAASGDVYVAAPPFSEGGPNFVVDAFSPQSPDVTTGAPTNVTAGGATLTGTVNPDGVAVTDCRFEYGTTTAYGQSAPCVETVGSVSGPVSVHADLTGLTAGQTYHFRLVATNSRATGFGADQLFGPPAIDRAFVDGFAATGVTAHAAISPQNSDTTYHIEYGATTAYGTSIPVPDADIGAGASDVAVSQAIGGLAAGTTYHFRVVATNSAGATDGPDQTFTTLPAALIDLQPPTGMDTATGLSTGQATLHAYVDPQGESATYTFEYGTTDSYGSSPSSASLAAAGSPQPVAEQIAGLAPDTTYHYRTVAATALGTADGPDSTFTTPPASCPNQQFRTGLSANLPDCRAYELVSPPDKAGYEATTPEVAPAGDRVAFGSLGAFAGAQANFATNEYVATRGATGWGTQSATPPASSGFAPIAPVRVAAEDLSRFAAVLLEPASVASFTEATGANVLVRQPTGSWQQVGPTLSPVRSLLPTTIGAAADLSHIVLSGGDPWLSSDTTPSDTSHQYEIAGATGSAPVLTQVNVDGNGSPMGDCGSGISSEGFTPVGQRPVSYDGSTIFLSFVPSGVYPACLPGDSLFARLNGSSTVAISDPSPNDECDTACVAARTPFAALHAASPSFAGASGDGKLALFLSTQQLTDSATEDGSDGAGNGGATGCGNPVGPNGCNLYAYDFNRPAGQNLIDVSAGDTSGLGPEVRGVVNVSQDGSKVYFVAGGVLTSQPNQLGQAAQPGALNFYVSDVPTGRTSFIGLLCSQGAAQSGSVADASCPSNSPGDAGLNNGGFLNVPSDATPDGRYLVFSSYAQLTPDDTNQARDVYEYDAQTGGLWRVSVGHEGQDQNGNGGGQDASAVPPVGVLARENHVISSDGQTVVFTTARPLQSSAANGQPDVYEWHQGEVTLVSGAGSSHEVDDAQLTPSGQDIVFDTDQGLLPQDTDGVRDVYDARVGGGFAAPLAPPAPCSGDACQGAPSGSPPAPVAGSVAFAGSGNIESGAPAPAAAPLILTRIVRGARFWVWVGVPAAGRVTIAGRGVGGVSRSLPRAGRYRLLVRLTATEARALKRKRGLRLSLRIAYLPAAGAASAVSVPVSVRR